MKKLIAVFVSFALGCTLLAQYPDTKWVIGYDGGDAEQDSFGLTVLDFYDNQLRLGDELEIDYQMRFNNATISRNDSLVLYFNGLAIHNGEHNVIVNGDDMYLGESSLGYEIPQGSLFLPLPESDDLRYYLINTHAEWNDEIEGRTGAKLYRSVIDLDLSNGESEIILKNHLLIEDTLAGGQLTATRHANGRDWWIIWRFWNSNKFIRFLLIPEGIRRLTNQTIGEPSPSGLGQAVFSPDGSRYIMFNTINDEQGIFLNIYDFDRCTGMLSNQIELQYFENEGAGGAAISHNSRYLYVFSVTKIFQYDLWAEDIEASRILVAEYDGFLSPYFPATFFLGQLARDGKIYVSSTNGVLSFTTIEYPDRPGLDCFVNQHSIQLPVFNAFGLPNFPNHRLGPLDGSPCDTLGIDNVPLASFRPDQDTSDYLSFYFQNLSAYEPTEWAWTFGDGGMSQDTSPTHTYQNSGTYEVCLTVSNANDSNMSCQTLEVGVVDTNNPLLNINLQVFPNPFKDRFSIVLNDYFPRQAQVKFYDISGRQVQQQRVFHGWNTVEGNSWPAGIYFYEVWDGNVQLGEGKIIRQ